MRFEHGGGDGHATFNDCARGLASSWVKITR